MDKSKVAKLVKKRRKELGLNQERLSKLSGVSVRKISDIETASGDTSVGTLHKVLDIMGMEITIQVKETDGFDSL